MKCIRLMAMSALTLGLFLQPERDATAEIVTLDNISLEVLLYPFDPDLGGWDYDNPTPIGTAMAVIRFDSNTLIDVGDNRWGATPSDDQGSLQLAVDMTTSDGEFEYFQSFSERDDIDWPGLPFVSFRYDSDTDVYSDLIVDFEVDAVFDDLRIFWIEIRDDLEGDSQIGFTGELSAYAPIPEPASWVLFAVGGLSAAWVVRRRARRARSVC